MTWEDPIVAEVRRIREELSAKFNYDLAAIFRDIRSREPQLGDRLIDRSRADEKKQVAGEFESKSGSL